jgi:hypothetical protein
LHSFTPILPAILLPIPVKELVVEMEALVLPEELAV